MYVTENAACSLPNSETPMPDSAIALQNARMARMASIFTNGDNTLNGIIQALGGNPIGASYGNAGVPTDGTLNPFTLPRGNWSIPAGGGGGTGGPGGGGSRCAPTVVPLMTVVPLPAVVASTPSNPTPRLLTPTPTPAAQVVPVAVPCPSDCAPTPENICRNLRDGCYKHGQVSQLQTDLCSMAGWAGQGRLKCPSGWNNGASIPDMNRAPLTPGGQSLTGLNPVFDRLSSGMSGFTGEGSSVLWGSIALGVFAFWAASQLDKPKRRR